MPQIKVQVDSQVATEATVKEILSATAAATGKTNNSAEVIRDSLGKVVSVNVNLPFDTAQASLETAAEKISQNRGVATAVSFPIVSGAASNSFSSLTPGSVFTDGQALSGFDVPITAYVSPFSPIDTSFGAAYAAESHGGTGSALMVAPKWLSYSPTTVQGLGAVQLYPADFSLSEITGGKVSFKMKRASTINSVAVSPSGTVIDQATVAMGYGPNGGNFSLLGTTVSNNNYYPVGTWYAVLSLGAFQTVDTGIPVDNNWVNVELEIMSSGIHRIKLNSFEAYMNANVAATWSAQGYAATLQFNRFIEGLSGLGASYVGSPLIIDDLKIEITSGTF